ncbi:YqeB family protein [Georgenia sp.]
MPGTTTVRQSREVRVALLLGYPIAGGLLASLAVLLVEWFAQASPAFDGVAGRGGHVGEPVALVVGAVLGIVGGAVWGGSALGESLRAVVGDRALTLTWDDARVSVPRTLVRTVVLDGDLVLIGPGAVELARVRSTLDRRDLKEALRRHGYPPAAKADPFAPAFTRWSAGTPELDTQEHRLLAARGTALAIDAFGDAELLRRQLAARGVMVREVFRAGRRERAQEWRRAAPSGRLSVTSPHPVSDDAALAEAEPADDDRADADPHAMGRAGPELLPEPALPVDPHIAVA